MSLIIAHSPRYAFWSNPYEWGAFEIDLARFARLIRGELAPPPRRLITRPTVADINQLIRGGGPIACDIETAPASADQPWTGKQPTRARLKSVGLGTPEMGLAHWWGSDAQVEQAIKRVLANPKITKVFHNGYWFDLPVLRRYGVRVRNIVDTRDLRRALSATSRVSLAHVASLYTDFSPWKHEEDSK